MFSNYQIKTMLPRLIIAAILINLSYYVCAALIDLSNIAGRSLYDLVQSFTPDATPTGEGWWTGVLSGTIALAGGTAALLVNPAIAFTALAAILAGFVAFLAGLLTMMLRNVVIILCIIMAPLAIVAYILPNTKKLFDQWWKMFSTMLLMYPLIAIFYSVAQFGGAIMINTADGNGWVQVGGLVVMAAPLFMLPFMIKRTSGVLSSIQDGLTKFGQRVTSEPLKNWANNSKDYINKQAMTRNGWIGNTIGRLPGMRGGSRAFDRLRRTRKTNTEAAENELAAEYNQGALGPNSRSGRALRRSIASKLANDVADKNIENLKIRQVRGSVDQVRLEIAEGEAKLTQSQLDADKALRATGKAGGPANADQVASINSLGRQANVQAMRKSTTEREEQRNFAAQLRSNMADQKTAAAFDQFGNKSYVDQARANADNIVAKANREAIDTIKSTTDAQTIKEFSERFNVALESRDDISARAYAELLGSSGSPGLNALGDVVSNVTLGSDLDANLRATVRGMGIKGKDALLDNWAVNVGNSMETVQANGAIIVAGLSDGELVTQATERAAGAITAARATDKIDPARRDRIYGNDTLGQIITERAREALT